MPIPDTVQMGEVSDAEIEALAQANRLAPAALRNRLEEEGRLAGLKETILFRKAVDFLIDQAIIKS